MRQGKKQAENHLGGNLNVRKPPVVLARAEVVVIDVYPGVRPLL